MGRTERQLALAQALDDLERYRSGKALGDFLTSRDLQRLVLHALYVAVQACIDEALELCVRLGLVEVRSYREAFVLLGSAGAVDPDLARRLADWAGFRNVLAHFYPVLDLERVWLALAELQDLRDFQDVIARTEAPKRE